MQQRYRPPRDGEQVGGIGHVRLLPDAHRGRHRVKPVVQQVVQVQQIAIGVEELAVLKGRRRRHPPQLHVHGIHGVVPVAGDPQNRHGGLLLDVQMVVHHHAAGVFQKIHQPLDILPLVLQAARLLFQGMVLLPQQLLQPLQILCLEYVFQVLEGKAHVLVPLDLVDEGKLAVGIVPVTSIRIDVHGLEQPNFIVMTQALDGHIVQPCRLTDGVEILHSQHHHFLSFFTKNRRIFLP